METRRTETRSRRTAASRTKKGGRVMNTATLRRGMLPETAVKKVFGTIGPRGALPPDRTARQIYKWQESEAEKFEASFWDCMEHANNTVEHVLRRVHQQLRGEADNLSRERPLEAKAMDALADHIEEGFR